ncbi:unnamed protein product [Rotaria sordida]|uniref:RING-type domain-containing protein n=1 Tax=Rotaria sordida TaxID=392033 RepID=A0A819DQA2_9BILA|nr:unnamed protein product [Rotaria sordida]CAF1300362.1 unnamed protein product [Rotaria sordida]CAF3834715.1 unnamed protein product [Rotaria sordida]CAF3931614.1 unnamed protein product [Rotaria sordida]
MRTHKAVLLCLNFQWQPSNRRSIQIVNDIIPKSQASTGYILSRYAIETITPNISSIHYTEIRSFEYTICRNKFKNLWIILNNLLDNDNITIDKHIQVEEGLNDIIRLNINNKTEKIKLTCRIEYLNDPSTDIQRYRLNKKNLFGIIFLITCVALTLILCIGWFIVIYYRQYERRQIKNKLKKTLAHSIQQILNKTPIIIFNSKNKTNDYIDDDPMCAICLESFIDNEKIRKLICLHYFHIGCIDPWLLANQSCPLCNRNILKDYVPSISANIASTNEELNNQESSSTNTSNFINNRPFIEL